MGNTKKLLRRSKSKCFLRSIRDFQPLHQTLLTNFRENKRGGTWEEPADYFKTKDNKGKTILCYKCGGAASAPGRAIIPCTFCGLNWHLDCLEVPMAKEPVNAKTWRCPIHLDDMLAIVPSALAPAHRFRKIKGAPVIKPALSRGNKNYGHIEIENDPTDDEEEVGFYEHREYGRVYKLSEKDIKLDFISKYVDPFYPVLCFTNVIFRVRKLNQGGRYVLPSQPSLRRPSPPNPSWDYSSLERQQAALNLAAFAVDLPDHSIMILIRALNVSSHAMTYLFVSKWSKLTR